MESFIVIMSFDLTSLTEDQLEFYNQKHPISQQGIVNHMNDGLTFDQAVATEATDSLISYYGWIRNNIKDTDKYKIHQMDMDYETDYGGMGLTDYEKNLFDKLPNIGKYLVGTYGRVWRGLQEAEECLMEFVYHEVDYLIN